MHQPQFDTVPVPTFTDEEYDRHLQADGWTADETRYLISVAAEWDLRFLVIADRYEAAGKRTLLELRSRYYEVMGRLEALRTGQTSPAFQYDADGERRLALAIESFDARPREQSVEEALLIRMARQVQLRLPQLWRRRQQIIATMAGETFCLNSPTLVDLLGVRLAGVDVDSGTASHPNGPPKPTKSKKRRPTVTKSDSVESGDSAHPKKPQIVTPQLRSHLLKPIKSGTILRQVEKAMADLGLPVKPVYPSERVCDLYDKIRAFLAGKFEQRRKSSV
jgi:DNA methyltransferase 1-associated protein 1